MNFKALLAFGAIGAAAGGVFAVARRRVRRDPTAPNLWAEVTDPVARFGGA